MVNTDRNNGNLPARKRRPRGAQHDEYRLILNDHSHCLVQPGQAAADLAGKLTTPPRDVIQHLPFVRDAITDGARLETALLAAEAIPDNSIMAIVEAVPDQLLTSQDKVAYGDFLKQRKAGIRALFAGNCADFPNLSP